MRALFLSFINEIKDNLILLDVSFSFIVLRFQERAKKKPEEIMEVTGIVTDYIEDVMYINVLRTGMNLPLRVPSSAKMNVFAAPKDTVLLIYTGDLGDLVHLPSIIEIKTRPFKETGSKVINLKELKNSGELIVKP